MKNKLLALIASLAAILTPVVVFAQDAVAAAPALAGNGWDIATTIYAVLGTAVSGLLTWGVKKLVDLVTARVDNELLRGIMGRLVASASDAVAMVNQVIKDKIQKAKSPDSPGGEKFTEEEKDEMFQAAWDSLVDEYGGWDGILRLLRRVGIGDETAARAKLTNLIESAVAKQKAEAKKLGPA